RRRGARPPRPPPPLRAPGYWLGGSPAGLGLGLDPLRHATVGTYADLAGDVEEPGALRHFDRMAIGADGFGHGRRRVADFHARLPRRRIAVGQNSHSVRAPSIVRRSHSR